MVCSLSALPTWGPGRLFMRDDGKYPGGEIDKKLFTTEHPGWKKIAEKMVAAGVGIDFFLAAPSGGYLDIATIGEFHVAHVRRVEMETDFVKVTCLLQLAAKPSTILTSSLVVIIPSCHKKSSIRLPEKPVTRRS